MTENSRFASLLPYLSTGTGRASLRFSQTSGAPAASDETSFPFLILNDTDPLASLLGGQFLSDAGCVLQDVFLLVERDRYLVTHDELRPLTNLDVESAWEKAFAYYSVALKNKGFVSLVSQVDESGKLAPLASLLLCKHRALFFHPPCPSCGLPLDLCKEDTLLSNAGLQPYSRSLKRYLFCPGCFERGKGDFYVYDREQSVTEAVKDWKVLVNEFGALSAAHQAMTRFPCATCPAHEECFGSSQKVLGRIVPFSFYPFRVFIFRAMSLNAVDFLAMLSGATIVNIKKLLASRGAIGRLGLVETMEAARGATNATDASFLFSGDERLFLEILYLKLSFLSQLMRLLPVPDPFRHPDLRASLDRFWVSLGDSASPLPFVWNFRVEAIDVGGASALHLSAPSAWRQTDLYSLGLTWYYVLLSNQKQEIGQISRAIKQALPGDPLFRPENIFWDPDGQRVTPNTLSVWQKTLELARSFLDAEHFPVSDWSLESFMQRLDELREEVRHRLFERPRDAALLSATPSEGVDESAIHAALLSIIDRWRAQATPRDTDELQETVILSTKGSEPQIVQPQIVIDRPPAGPTRPGDAPTPRPAEPIDEPFSETVILHSSQAREGDATRKIPVMAGMADGSTAEETQIQEIEIKPGEDSIAETVILTVQDRTKPKGKKQ